MPDILLQFAHVTDTHLVLPGQQRDYSDVPPELEEYARQILALPYSASQAAEALVREINALPVRLDFVLHTGDLAGQLHSPDDYAYIRQVFDQIRYPVCYVPGNHDAGEPFQRVLLRRDPPYDQVFDRNGVQIACLDSTGTTPPHSGWLDDEQLAWLDRLCSADDDRPLIVALHHPPFEIGVPWLDELRLLNGDEVRRILQRAKSRLRGVFCGHVHHAIDVHIDGILYSIAPSAWCQFTGWPGHSRATLDEGARPGFSLVTITTGHTMIRRYHYPVPGPS
jgi:Icc protein